jgi:hypothetical protein
MEIGAFEALLDRHRQVIDVAAFDLHAPVDQRADPVVIPGGDGDGEAAHAVLPFRARTIASSVESPYY